MKDQYDFSNGVRGKYAGQITRVEWTNNDEALVSVVANGLPDILLMTVAEIEGLTYGACNCEIADGICNCEYYRMHGEATLPEDEFTRDIEQSVSICFKGFVNKKLKNALFVGLVIVVPGMGAALLIRGIYKGWKEREKFRQYIRKTYGHGLVYNDKYPTSRD